MTEHTRKGTCLNCGWERTETMEREDFRTVLELEAGSRMIHDLAEPRMDADYDTPCPGPDIHYTSWDEA